MTGIQPISYEDELIQRRTEIQRDKHGDMLLFPEDDVTVNISMCSVFFIYQLRRAIMIKAINYNYIKL